LRFIRIEKHHTGFFQSPSHGIHVVG